MSSIALIKILIVVVAVIFSVIWWVLLRFNAKNEQLEDMNWRNKWDDDWLKQDERDQQVLEDEYRKLAEDLENGKNNWDKNKHRHPTNERTRGK